MIKSLEMQMAIVFNLILGRIETYIFTCVPELT